MVVLIVLHNAQIGGFFNTLWLQNAATCLHTYIIYLYKRPVFRGFTVIFYREVTHTPIRDGQSFHMVCQENMNYAKIIVYREYKLLNANSLVNILALNVVKPRKLTRI